MFEGCSPEPAGGLLEAPGDGVSRWMIAPDPWSGQDPAYRSTRSHTRASAALQVFGEGAITLERSIVFGLFARVEASE